MKGKPLPDAEVIRKHLRYDRSTGKLFWKRRGVSSCKANSRFTAESMCQRWNTRHAGKEAFTAVESHKEGKPRYRVGWLLGVRYHAHRLIWKLIKGEDPLEIDHIDGNGENNRIKNLRSVCHGKNSRNQKLRNTNSSGVNGVRWNLEKEKWQARVKHRGKEKHLGYFDDLEQAAEARRAWDRSSDFHANHGRAA